MPANYQNIQNRLRAFDLTGLFTQELMWNHYVTRDLAILIDGATYTLKPVAQRGMAVFQCVPPTDAEFPKYCHTPQDRHAGFKNRSRAHHHFP